MKKIFAFVVNNPAYFISHRLAIGLSLLEQGHEVYVIGPSDCPQGLQEQGFIFQSVSMSRKGKNPFAELNTIFELYKLFKRIKPDVVHLVTIKPYLYGGIAARLAGVPAVVSAVAGLGTLFIENTFKYRFLRAALYPAYRFAFGHKNQTLIFQNDDDRSLLLNWLKISNEKTVLIRGSGVSLQDYPVVPEQANHEPIVALASRLLKDKGVVEFVEACKILQQRGVKARYWLIGSPDAGNSNTVSQAELDAWRSEGLVECLGYRQDIAELFAQANIVTLPSYREGLPRVLVEAAACARAVVTTDVPGCRDAITANETGLLVPVRDSESLADALQRLIEDGDLRGRMGQAGRQLAEDAFAIQKIVEQHMDVYQRLMDRSL